MKQRRRDRTSRKLPLVVVLLFSFVLTAFNITPVEAETGIEKKSNNGWTKQSTQIPFEEQENEIEGKGLEKTHSLSFVLALIRQMSQLLILQLTLVHSAGNKDQLALYQSIPLYLSNRTLLI